MNDISDIETGIEGVCSSLEVQFKTLSALVGVESNRRNILYIDFI